MRPSCSHGITVHNETLGIGQWTGIILVAPPLDEGGQSRGVQGDFGIIAIVRLEPGMEQTGSHGRPPAGVHLQCGPDEVLSGLADTGEILQWEGEIHPADVHTGLLAALV